MSQPFIHSEELATEWASRVCSRLTEIGVPQSEVDETRNIIFSFTRIAAEELCKERQVKLPHLAQPFVVESRHAHQIIDLFLRGVNHTAKKMRDTGMDWSERREHMENLAWKLFNLAKLLIAFMYNPDPNIPKGLGNEKELQLMMKQSADHLLQEELGLGSGLMALPLLNMKKWKP